MLAEIENRPSVDESIVVAQLGRICSSRAFRLSPRLIRFLEFTVRKALEGTAQDLKEYLVGVEVYGRGEDFDPKSDSIVRSEAVRLRSRLERYYATEGKTDRLRISYPKGCYIPHFDLQDVAEQSRVTTGSRICNTIAVLPFANVGGSADGQFFGDGLTEELIAAFGSVSALRVVARSSCFQFQGKAVDVREAGRLLNSEWVLEGSVRSWRGRVRVTAQMIEVATGLHLWSDVFDRQADDLFAIQHEIACAILASLGLSRAQGVAAPDDPETYMLCVKARHHWAKYSVEGAERSCSLYERALAKSPRYARAWAGLAHSLNFLAHRGHSSLSNVARARNAVHKALEIDPGLADAHAVNAVLLGFNDRNWTDAESSFRRAVKLAPGDAGILHTAGVCLMVTGRFGEAFTFLTRAAELDPLACNVQMDIGILFRLQGKSDDAITQCRAALELDPNHREAEWQLGLALQQAGRFAEAMASFGRAAGRPGEELPALGTIGHCYAGLGQKDVAARMLGRLESVQDQDPATMLHARALIHIALSEPEDALTCLEQCAQFRSSRLALLKYDWRFAQLTDTPRFQAILKDLGFPGS